MELSKTFLDIIYDKTCFLCFKVCPEMMNVADVLEIRGPSSTKTLKFTEIVQSLFPGYDIICTQSCRPCSDLLIKMYITMYKNNFIQNFLCTMTEDCNNIIDETDTEKQVTIDFNKSFKDKSKKKGSKDKICSRMDEPSNINVANIDMCHRNYKRIRRKRFYNCDKCSYRSLCKGTLEGHINKYHIKTRPFTCGVCCKSFYTKSNLTEHQRTHSKVSEICEICGDVFARKQSLVNHLKLHANVRAYKCVLCEKSFVNSGRRLEHMKRNHLEKHECCMFCDKRFAMKKELIRHLKSVHA